jgi:hypothetical protein
LNVLVEEPFAALVIIDELPDKLETVLAAKFRFGVETLVIEPYESQHGDLAYRFEPFLADLAGGSEIERNSATRPPDVSEIDTIVVPAREDGFQEEFLGKHRWYAVRIHGTMRPQIRYVAAYRVAPESAITHVAPVASIEPWADSGKFVITFSEPPKQIGPVKLVPGGVKAPQNIRYTAYSRLIAAKTLDEAW